MSKIKKLNPKIIRIGDTIKIINPTFVIRCGYPLGIEDMKKEIETEYGSDIDQLMHKAATCDKIPSDLMCLSLSDSNNKSKAYYDIIKALAYVRLKTKNFGGNERTLHTKVIEEARSMQASVISVKIVQTGTYYPGYSNYSYDGEYNGCPAGLSNAKCHKILTLDFLTNPNKNDYLYNTNIWTKVDISLDNLMIEATNVEKIPSVMETPVEYEHRIKQMEKTTNG